MSISCYLVKQYNHKVLRVGCIWSTDACEKHINGSLTIKKDSHSMNEVYDKNIKHHKIDNCVAMTRKEEKLLQRYLR